MAGKLGSVIFEQDLKWVPRNEDVQVMGSDTRTMGGNIVSLRTSPKMRKTEFRTYRFGRITFSDWRNLKSMAESGAVYDFAPDDSGATHKVLFAQQNPIRIDSYDEASEIVTGGEMRLIFNRED